MEKANLVNALEIVRPGLARKEMIEQTTSFAFMDGAVVTYNDEISIRHPIDIGVEGAVGSEKLYNFLTKTDKDEVEIEEKGDKIQLKAGKALAGIKINKDIQLPVDHFPDDDAEWQPLPENFADMVRFCLFSCASDMTRPVLNSIHVTGTMIESTDTFRMTRCTFPNSGGDELLIPLHHAKELVKYTCTHLTFTKNWIHFRTDQGSTFSCRIFSGEYPDISGFFAVDGHEITLPKTIEEVLSRAAIFSARENYLDEQLFIDLEDKQLTVSATSDEGWFKESHRVRYSDDPLQMIVVPRLLSEILKVKYTCTIGEDAIKFEGENWEHLVKLSSGE